MMARVNTYCRVVLSRLPGLFELFGLFALMVLVPAAQSHARATGDSRMYDYDAKHYSLAFDFDFAKASFRGVVGMDAQILHPTNTIVLCAANATLNIDSVSADGVGAVYSHYGDLLAVTLRNFVQPNRSVHIEIYYRGKARFEGQYDAGGMFIGIVRGLGRVATSSEPNFARNWWPCKDLPDDKATVNVKITVPGILVGISNGLLKSVNHVADKTVFEWESKYQTATYLVNVTVGNYKHFTDSYPSVDGKKRMKLEYYVYPEDYNKARVDFQNTPDILRFFASTFCEYPFIDEKFGYVEVDGNMTMENQTICSVDDRLITGDRKYEYTLIHEIAHHWWGNLITPSNWRHTWLNEGFATYAEALYAEHLGGQAGYRSYMNNLMNVKMGHYSGSVIGRSDTAYWDSFSPRVYNKGAIILHMLRGVIGDSAFFTAMRNYLNNPKYRYANASTEDYMAECEAVYGKPLQWFFQQWVYGYTESVDRPEYEYDWTSVPSKTGYTVSLSVTQKTALKLLYRMPLNITITAGDAPKQIAVIDSLPSQVFSFKLDEKPTWLEIDRSNWVYKILTRKGGY